MKDSYWGQYAIGIKSVHEVKHIDSNEVKWVEHNFNDETKVELDDSYG